MSKALVITPTTGSPELLDAILSVNSQTYSTDHLIVVDGQQFSKNVDDVFVAAKLSGVNHEKLFRVDLPFNTGGNGFYGHRVMAAFSHLINHDYVLFLDQDNWFQTNHVETLVGEIEKYKFDWAHSLRKIYDKDKEFVCDDNCESLGRWPVWVNKDAHLVDSSSYCFTAPFLRKVGHLWDHGWGADRRFYTIVKDQLQHRNYGCTSLHTLNYRLGGNEGSVQGDFFIQGNEQTLKQYDGKLPWLDQYS